jgi:hypothetical protein
MAVRTRMAGVMAVVVAFTAAMASAPPTDFAGTWVFNPSKSTNVGMMAAADLVSTVTQTAAQLVVRDDGSLNGSSRTHETRYDLTGASVANESPMGEPAHTTTKWVGKTLVTKWESEGAVAGTTTVRTETRSLSPDGKTMYLESSRGDAAAMVIVFDRK